MFLNLKWGGVHEGSKKRDATLGLLYKNGLNQHKTAV